MVQCVLQWMLQCAAEGAAVSAELREQVRAIVRQPRPSTQDFAEYNRGWNMTCILDFGIFLSL